MIITVYAGGALAYDSRLPVEKGYVMESIYLREKLNTGGSATLVIPSQHPMRDGFPAFRTLVEIYRDGALRWRGRALPEARDFYCRGTITCEGELCFLQDAVLRPGSYVGDLASVFALYMTAYNNAVEPWKRFVVGNITVTTPDVLNVEKKTGEKVYKAIMELVSQYGGYIIFDSAPDGSRRINWYQEMPYSCNQRIMLGYNLTDYSSSVNVSGFATRIIPYGAENEMGIPITIDVDGKDYVQNTEAVAQRGVIEAAVSYPEISDPIELLEAAQRDVDKVAALPETIKLSALDMSRHDLTLDAFRLGQRVEAVSDRHGLSDYYDLLALEEDLVNPGVGGISLIRDAAYADAGGAGTLTGAVSSQGKQDNSRQFASWLTAAGALASAILGADGGCVRLLDSNGDDLPDELYVADDPNIEKAVNVWRLNYMGLAASSNGYNGPFELGMALGVGILTKFIQAGAISSAGEGYIPPTYDDVANMLWSLSFPEQYPPKAFYDLNGDGVFDVTDVRLANEIYLGKATLADCPGAYKTPVTVTIDPTDTEKAIQIVGVNMWGSDVVTSMGVSNANIPVIKGDCSIGGRLAVGGAAILGTLATQVNETPKTLSWKDNGDGTYTLVGS